MSQQTPPPWVVVRTAVLLGAAGQVGRSHRLLHLGQLRAGLEDGRHVNLVLEIGRGDFHRFGEPDQGVCLGEIAGQGLLNDNPLELGPIFHHRRDLSHHGDTGKIRGEDADDVHGVNQVGDGVVRLGVTEMVLAGQLRQRLGPLEGVDAGELDVPHRAQGPLVKPGDETRTNHPDLQHSPIPTQILTSPFESRDVHTSGLHRAPYLPQPPAKCKNKAWRNRARTW